MGDEADAAMSSRVMKVRKIFEKFDENEDGRLNRAEMAALVIAVNPRVKFSEEQIGAILDEVFRTYHDFIHGDAGLSFEGLLRTYDDGAGDVDRDFEALHLELDDSIKALLPLPSLPLPPPPPPPPHPHPSSTVFDERNGSNNPQNQVVSVPPSPNNGIRYDNTWRLVEDLQILIRRLEGKLASRVKENKKDVGNNHTNGLVTDASSDGTWSRDLGFSGGGGGGSLSGGTHDDDVIKRNWEDLGHDYVIFQRELGEVQAKADRSKIPEEAFDACMGIGRTLFDHALYVEALASFKRASEIKPTDARPHFRLGNTLYSLGRPSEAKDCYLSALDAAEILRNQWSYLLPHIHVNLGVALEAEGMLLSASEHYKEAAIREPKHYRALKLLGSALYGVGEYRAAEKALMEAIFLKNDYADAHCDLGSTLHAMGDDERAVHEFQKAIDLKPDHLDALYNLGGLFRDIGRYQRAAEMYTKVLVLQPNHWKAQLNKAVSLLGAGESEEARKSFKEAFKLTNRIELYDALVHLKLVDNKRPRGLGSFLKKGDSNAQSLGINANGSEHDVVIIEASHFKQVNTKTTPRQWLSSALEIRHFQRQTRLGRCNVGNVKKEFMESQLPISSSGGSAGSKSVRKEFLEKVMRRLLPFLRPDTFQGTIKAINGKILSVLDGGISGRVDVGMFFALIAPICSGTQDKRKRVAFEALVWRSSKEVGAISKSDASLYLKLLRAVYFPIQGASAILEVYQMDDQTLVSFPEFVEMFDDPDWGFGILDVLVRLENTDGVRHYGQTCAVCAYPIIGPWFKEISSSFALCSLCYSEGKVPASAKQDEYCFKEYRSDAEVIKDRLCLFRSKSSAHNT